MLIRELITAVDRWDKAGIWAFSLKILQLLFPEDSRTMLKAISSTSASRSDRARRTRTICESLKHAACRATC